MSSALVTDRWITSLDELRVRAAKRPHEPVLLLYSGGLDGSYFLSWAARHQVNVLAMHAEISAPDESQAAALRAKQLGAEFTAVNVRQRFFDEFVTAAVHGNAWYHGLYPVGSTLSRPLFAAEAIRVARARGCGIIVHTATFMQNTTARIGRTIAALAPELVVAAPFIRETPERPAKQAALAKHGINIPDSRFSVDANPWARVIENDTLENPERDIPSAGVFRWTAEPGDRPSSADIITVSMEQGVPIQLDSVDVGLDQIVDRLNSVAGQHGIGRYSGVEGLRATGLKNHEIREAPAATVLTLVHRALESAVLTDEELTAKRGIDELWTTWAVTGDWFGMAATSLRECSRSMDRATSGTVRVELGGGQVRVLAVQAPAGLYYHRFGVDFDRVSASLSMRELMTTWTLPDVLRAQQRGSEPIA